MTEEARCERTELLVSTCSHCQPKKATFTAMYGGVCTTCGYPIVAGQQVRETGEGTYEHGRH
jgi:hypothetical protein